MPHLDDLLEPWGLVLVVVAAIVAALIIAAVLAWPGVGLILAGAALLGLLAYRGREARRRWKEWS